MNSFVGSALMALAVCCFSFSSAGAESLISQQQQEETVIRFEEALSDGQSLSRIAEAIEVVDRTATPEEKIVLESMREVVREFQADLVPPGKTKKKPGAGQFFAKLGLGIHRLTAKTVSPFFRATGFLTGRYEKNPEFDEDGGSGLSNYLARLANQFRMLQNEAVAVLLERLMEGDHLTALEVNLIIEAIPRLGMREWEPIAGIAGYHVSSVAVTAVLSNVLGVAGLAGLPWFVFHGYYIGVFGATMPCAFEKAQERHPALKKYCQDILEAYEMTIFPARIKGYVKGVNARNRARERARERKELREQRQAIRQE